MNNRTVGMRKVFARPGFGRLWIVRTASQCGDVFATVALALVVFDLTGSARGVGAVVLAEILPVLLLAPVAGFLYVGLGAGPAFAINRKLRHQCGRPGWTATVGPAGSDRPTRLAS